MYLIQGCWFQTRTALDIETDSFSDPVAVARLALLRAMFYGVLHPELECCGYLFHPDRVNYPVPAEGWIRDEWGESILYDVSVTTETASFTKVYSHRKDTIVCTFLEKSGNIWIGEYSGEIVGVGAMWASIVPLARQFFEPANFARLAKKAVLHEWHDHRRN